jgi:hydrogenase expression/formation protein HypE
VGEVVAPLSLANVSDNDVVIITGTIGDHGTAIILAREEFDIDARVESDCAPLIDLLKPLFEMEDIKWMRDPTRGGVATVLVELSTATGLGIEVYEENLPMRDDVSFISDMLGYDPLYLANEGKAVIIASDKSTDRVMEALRRHELGKDAAVIGRVSDRFSDVRIRTRIGGERFLDLLEEELLPRIC